MMVLLTYDVQTTDKLGISRLRKVAKLCEDYGQRVQNSVFELVVTPAELTEIKIKMLETIDEEKDSVRYYHLGSNWQIKVETAGKATSFDPENDVFIF